MSVARVCDLKSILDVPFLKTKCRYFLTASYDGSIRTLDYSRNVVNSTLAHPAPITSICVVPTASSSDTHLVASASHDLTAQLTQFSIPSDSKITTKALASLHLHTGPVSSVSSNLSGSHLLTASWDGLIGLWDTHIPSTDEVPEPVVQDRKKRRKVVDDADRPKRKAPVTVLKSHTARVSKAVFATNGKTAYSCGFDSTVRTWDVENGICTDTIVRILLLGHGTS